jgi:small nuclear ribonucleoprotein (snRNP)-like protein
MGNLSLNEFLECRVVLDTSGPMLYIGRLTGFDPDGFWLIDADVHDRSDGHSTKEQYVNEAHELERSGSLRVNRRRVYVERRAVISISRLADVVVEEQDAETDVRSR